MITKGMYTIRACTIAIGIAFLSACASMNQLDCHNADWHAVGLMDGTHGKTLNVYENYDRDCSKVHVTPDRRLYLEGRSEGLAVLCTKPQGYEFGREGGEYEYVCPRALEKAFLEGYRPGNRLYTSELLIKRIDDAIAKLTRSNRELQVDIDNLEFQMQEGSDNVGGQREKLEQIGMRKSEMARNQASIDDFIGKKDQALVEYKLVIQANRVLGFPEEEKY